MEADAARTEVPPPAASPEPKPTPPPDVPGANPATLTGQVLDSVNQVEFHDAGPARNDFRLAPPL